jgi:2-C-methyl-D-erythritol 4-phosphate cytidylyltransferase
VVGVAVPAAGGGARMGGVRKPFLDLAGEPILLRSLRPFLHHPWVRAVVVALGEEDLRQPPGWLQAADPSRIRLVRGGATRGESVLAALEALPTEVEVVAVHDAARPLVTRAIIDRCLEAVRADRGAVVGWPAVDTLKEVDGEGRIVRTPPRERIWHAQTPQAFPREMLLKAYREGSRAGLMETDDAALVERVGGESVMVPGSPSNMKITRPGDLALAEVLLRGGGG